METSVRKANLPIGIGKLLIVKQVGWPLVSDTVLRNYSKIGPVGLKENNTFLGRRVNLLIEVLTGIIMNKKDKYFSSSVTFSYERHCSFFVL